MEKKDYNYYTYKIHFCNKFEMSGEVQWTTQVVYASPPSQAALRCDRIQCSGKD